MNKYFALFVTVAIFSLLLIGCASQDVVRASAIDWVWGVEELRSGASRIWLRHDNIAGYCTADSDIAESAKDMLGEKILITFASVHSDDPEAVGWGESGCSRLYTGSESSTPIFRILSLERLEDADDE